MRIGFDMLALQSPHHGRRGIGRYSRHLVSAMLARDDGHEYVLYAHAALPVEEFPSAPNASLRCLGGDMLTAPQRVDRLARANPDRLDALVVLSPFELWSNYSPAARWEGGPRQLAVVYDMIPFLFPRDEAYDPVLSRHFRVLEELKRYDALLAISEATRRDCLRLLGIAPDRVTTIGAASDPQFFTPDHSESSSAESRSILKGLGINRPFVLNVGGFDARKNLWTLIDAFALLPEPLRRGLQLVLTFTVLESDRDRLLRHARAAGLGDALVVTGEVSDAALRVLYQRCAVFVFPSLYEGFGLPLLEAMHCGAAVVAGNNSSQVEVVGEAGLLANASDARDIAAKLECVLGDRELSQVLRTRAVMQAERFSWSATAARAAAVLESLPPRRPVAPLRAGGVRRGTTRPRIAFFSPFPPRKSGIADYSAALIRALQPTYTIDLFHEPGYVPEPALAEGGLASCDARLFSRQAAVRDYDAVVYQMGNSRYHNFLYKTMLRHPGVVTLHDFCLAGFHLDQGYRQGRGLEHLRDELVAAYPGEAEAIAQVVRRLSWNWEALTRECAERGWYLNRAVIESAAWTVVHSAWCLERVRADALELAERVEVIPLGCTARAPATAVQRAAIRERFGLPREALIVASLGSTTPEKMGPEALDAFRAMIQTDPSARFVFAGEEADGGNARAHAVALGLADRVGFLGRLSAADYTDLVAAVDVGLCLRRPPTFGETSAALLDFLCAGVATIVTNVGTFTDFPDTVVQKVCWDAHGPKALARALGTLAGDCAARAALGSAAREHVRVHHDWSRVAECYTGVIERCHEARRRGASSPECQTAGLGQAVSAVAREPLAVDGP